MVRTQLVWQGCCLCPSLYYHHAADLLSLDDLSIGVPKQRLIVKLVPGFTDEDRIVSVACHISVPCETTRTLCRELCAACNPSSLTT